MYAVIIRHGGQEVVKVLSATTYKVFVTNIVGSYKKNFEVDKDLMLFSSCSFFECLEFIRKK